ncbi:MAG: pyridoxamine 5'-phosphate oxidase family protein [Actinomycetia bacterium]|nr:pyridoxamine 5'-phosphate oxidase family protein [Actinomycetes bacterium]
MSAASDAPSPVVADPSIIRDQHGLEVIAVDECWRLLASAPVGRLGFNVAGRVQILPVTYKLHDRSIIFRTAPGEKLWAAVMRQPVAFEIDAWNSRDRNGWSVLAVGVADEVTDPTVTDQLDASGLAPWAPTGHGDQWVRIMPEEVTGRRLR